MNASPPSDFNLIGDRVLSAYPFTEEDFQTISTILHGASGIYLPDTKSTLVYSRLTKRLRALGLESFRDYCKLLTTDNGASERQQMIAALTTNVTRFFREPHHFEHLKKHVLAPKADKLKKGERLRVWSAACSDGQEPYSIAMAILAVIPEAYDLDIRVLATDIDLNMIGAATRGFYCDDVIAMVPQKIRNVYFERSEYGRESGWIVGERLASLVIFRELNLMNPWPMKGRFDAIFCRNVAIYFEEKTQQSLWMRFAPILTTDGRLYIGHSERVSGAASLHFLGDGVTTYRLRQGAVS